MAPFEELHAVSGCVSRRRKPGSKLRSTVIKHWKTSLSSVGGSEKFRKKVLTVLLYFVLLLVMAAVFVGAEYQNDK